VTLNLAIEFNNDVSIDSGWLRYCIYSYIQNPKLSLSSLASQEKLLRTRTPMLQETRQNFDAKGVNNEEKNNTQPAYGRAAMQEHIVLYAHVT